MNIAVVETSQDEKKYSTDQLKQLKKEIDEKGPKHHKKILEIIVKHEKNFLKTII